VTKHALFTLLLALSMGQGQATAQTIYKCTSGGQTSYGEAPCAAGSMQQMLEQPAAPPPAPASAERSEQLRQQADNLTKQRHQREAKEEQVQQRADKTAARQRERCASLKLHQRWAFEDAAQGKNAGKDSAKAALKTQRAAEKLALACPR
jgi:type IV secretory pathway VirB10-like protein